MKATSLTSPVLSSVAALLTIFLVALTDYFFKKEALSGATITGGLLIIVAFALLSWATYREMVEEERKRQAEEGKNARAASVLGRLPADAGLGRARPGFRACHGGGVARRRGPAQVRAPLSRRLRQASHRALRGRVEEPEWHRATATRDRASYTERQDQTEHNRNQTRAYGFGTDSS